MTAGFLIEVVVMPTEAHLLMLFTDYIVSLVVVSLFRMFCKTA